MTSAQITSLPELVGTICRRACLTDPDDIRSAPIARTRITGAGLEEEHLFGLDWTDVIVSATRFTATTIEGAHFHRVIFQDCDLSGLTFIDCMLRDCVFADVKSRAQIQFVNTKIDGVYMTKITLDQLEFQRSKIGNVTVASGDCHTLSFHQCTPMNRNSALTLTQMNLTSIGGLVELRKSGVSVHLDAELWRLLGDLFLREQGFNEIGGDNMDEIQIAIAGAAEELKLPQLPAG
ncbi:MAG: hypothetical protein HOH43_02880 [Candidatus Latescibacteria bacterium]|nr:hypothetical protein [Candidatus Latescibacterota bacterium]